MKPQLRDLRRQERGAICARADQQYESWLEGDPNAMYGDYPAARLQSF